MRRYTVKMPASFEDAVTLVTTALGQRGFHVVRSFDLAGTLDPDDPACSCPHHGTERCTCRYTILLVYRPTRESGSMDFAPHSIAIHGRDGEAYIGLLRLEPRCETAAEMAAQEDTLVQALVEASLSLLDAQ
jgi:hypothetical protein